MSVNIKKKAEWLLLLSLRKETIKAYKRDFSKKTSRDRRERRLTSIYESVEWGWEEAMILYCSMRVTTTNDHSRLKQRQG